MIRLRNSITEVIRNEGDMLKQNWLFFGGDCYCLYKIRRFQHSTILPQKTLFYHENTKKPPKTCSFQWFSSVFNELSGERGIRTPGSVDTEQRFSRPPHSTALPSLL